MGCFWGAERVFWQAEGVYTTAVGYAGGYTPNPTYEEVCSGSTGHAEVVLVVFDPAKTTYEKMLRAVLGEPRPDPGDASGQRRAAPSTARRSTGTPRPTTSSPRPHATPTTSGCSAEGYPEITTEIAKAGPFYYAEDYHQQYLHKNPWGYCGLGGTGVSCPVGRATSPPQRGTFRPWEGHNFPRLASACLLAASGQQRARVRVSAGEALARHAKGSGVCRRSARVPTTTVPPLSKRRALRRQTPEPAPPATAGRIVTTSPSETARVEVVEEADVLLADVDVDEPPQTTVLGDPAAQLAVALVEGVEHLADGRAVDGGQTPSPPVASRSWVGIFTLTDMAD